MQKLIIKNKYQSLNRINILTAAGIAQINEPITPQNGERIFGGLGVVTFNQASQYSEEENTNDPITPPNCPNCGSGIKPEPSVQPGANCEKKNISELKQILDYYANQSFCDKEFPEVQFSTFIGYDKPPSDNTAKKIELRMLCPSDECSDDEDEEQDTYLYAWAGTNDEDFVYIPCELKSTKEITQTIEYILSLKANYCVCDFEDMSPQDWYNQIQKDENGKYLDGCYYLGQFSSYCDEQGSNCQDCCEPVDFGFLICVGDDGKYFCR